MAIARIDYAETLKSYSGVGKNICLFILNSLRVIIAKCLTLIILFFINRFSAFYGFNNFNVFNFHLIHFQWILIKYN